MKIEFGIWDHFERRPGAPAAQQYKEKLRLIAEAERLGFQRYYLAEHHLTPLDLAPSPSVFLSALAQATSRIRIGAAVYCLPLYHPLRLVQELCMLDNLAEGRLDIGVGRGIRAAEHDWFGVPQDEVRPRFEETLQIMLGAMATGRLNHEGRFFHFNDLPLDVLPVQQPHPPLWYAGGIEAAAQGGFCFLGRGPADIQRYWQLYHAQDGASPQRVNAHLGTPTVAITRHLVVRRSYQEAEDLARRSWPSFEEHWYHTPVLVNEDGHAATRPSAQPAAFDDAIRDDRRLVVGTPAMVRDRLSQWLEQAGETPNLSFLPAVQWGDITSEEALQTLQLLSEDVAPAFER